MRIFDGGEVHCRSHDTSLTVTDRAKMTDESWLERLLVAEDIISKSSDHVALQEKKYFIQIVAWREKIAQWFYDVVDYMNEPRSIVYVAMNILDRYSAVELQKEEIVVGQTYKIAAMTAIFLAIRVAGSGDLRINDLIRASRGNFGVQDVISTGRSMLDILTWGIRLVTPHDFVDAILQCLPSKVPAGVKSSLRAAASYLVELSVYDVYFARLSASKVAMAAILNSTETTVTENELNFSELSAFQGALSQVTNSRISPLEGLAIKSRLRSLYNRVEGETQYKSLHYVSDEDGDDNDTNDQEECVIKASRVKHPQDNTFIAFVSTASLNDHMEENDSTSRKTDSLRKRNISACASSDFETIAKRVRQNSFSCNGGSTKNPT